jgi:hypothetical protein
MTLPIDTSYFGIPLIVFGMVLCAYGVFDFIKRDGITADGVIHILIGIFVMFPGFIFFVRGG